MTSAGVTQLGYLEIETAEGEAWLSLARAIGVEIVETPGQLAGLRLDAHRHARLHLRQGSAERLSALGWEASGPEEYRAILQRLEDAGAEPRERPDLEAARNVQAVAQFVDPDGMPGEVCWGAQTTVRKPFRSPEQVAFVAGAMGVGHVTLSVRSVRATQTFYGATLGLKFTEVADVGALKVTFLRAGPRHHSLAITEVPSGASAVDHIMIEVATLDDLGGMRDRLMMMGHRIERDLGRHPTDGVISMYLATPASFTLEVGWGSIVVDERTWDQDRYLRSQWSWGHRIPGGAGRALGEGG